MGTTTASPGVPEVLPSATRVVVLGSKVSFGASSGFPGDSWVARSGGARHSKNAKSSADADDNDDKNNGAARWVIYFSPYPRHPLANRDPFRKETGRGTESRTHRRTREQKSE